MRETETFEYIRQKYPDKEEKWRKVTQLVKFDENLEVKSVHDFNINCYISTFGRLIRNGILCNMAYGDKYDISSMFTDKSIKMEPYIKYTLIETKAPEGYKLNPTPYEFYFTNDSKSFISMLFFVFL